MNHTPDEFKNKEKLVAFRLSKAEYDRLIWITRLLKTTLSGALRTLINQFRVEE